MSGFQTVEENSIKRSIKSILETVQFEVFEVQSLNFRNFETHFDEDLIQFSYFLELIFLMALNS